MKGLQPLEDWTRKENFPLEKWRQQGDSGKTGLGTRSLRMSGIGNETTDAHLWDRDVEFLLCALLPIYSQMDPIYSGLASRLVGRDTVVEGKEQGLAIRVWSLELIQSHLLVLWLQASYRSSLSLSSLICDMRVAVSTPQVIEWE